MTFLRATPAGPPVLGRAGTSAGDVPSPATDAGTPVDPQAVAGSDDVYAHSTPASDSPFQRYDVPVTRALGAKSVDLSWEGRVASTGRSRSRCGTSTGELDRGRRQRWHGRRRHDAGREDRPWAWLDRGVVHLLVEARDPFDEVPSDADRAFDDPGGYSFSVAWMTDTQYLAQGGSRSTPRFAETYHAMAQWMGDTRRRARSSTRRTPATSSTAGSRPAPTPSSPGGSTGSPAPS